MDDLATLERRVDYWVDVLGPLGLSGWEFTIEIVDEPEGKPNSWAAIHLSPYYDRALIEFCRERLADASEHETDQTIVHELLHAAHRDFWDACLTVKQFYSEQSWQVHYDRLDHEMEGFIDRTARAIVAAHHEPWSEVVEYANSSNHPEHACPTQTTPSSN